MSTMERRSDLRYGTHSSDTNEFSFVHMEVTEQVQDVQIAVFPWEAIADLPKLWPHPVAVIPLVGRSSRLVYDFT